MRELPIWATSQDVSALTAAASWLTASQDPCTSGPDQVCRLSSFSCSLYKPCRLAVHTLLLLVISGCPLVSADVANHAKLAVIEMDVA